MSEHELEAVANEPELHEPKLHEPEEGQLSHIFDEATLGRSIEAILMVVDEPVSELTLATVLEVTVDQISAALERLTGTYDDRGFTLKAINGGWRFYSNPEFGSAVEKFVLDGQQNRLTQAALETLAVIAYRQPVSRARVSAIRGVNVEAVMKTLITRGLVEEYGVENETGAILYKTTSYFLERLALNKLEDLPPLAPHLPDIDSLDEILDSLTD
ncbi:MAG: SMC-Scp complex subunit ScpB [Actinobacteria bacterium]|nr:SMC-Scp complex subunit ScpB [Actinomycetota bacterium]